MAIRTKKEYFTKITNPGNLLLENESKSLEQAQQAIEEEIVSYYTLIKDLQDLVEQDKVALIAALIRNDQNKIYYYLNSMLQKNNIDLEPDILKQITQITDFNDSGEWISSTTVTIIQGIVSNCDEFEEAEILRLAMQSIPDSELTVQVKNAIITSLNADAAHKIDSYAYTAPLYPMEKNKYQGDIGKNEYFSIYRYERLDISEYLICTVGLLQNLIQTSSEMKLLEELRIAYDEVRYADALSLVATILNSETFQVESYRIACQYIIERGNNCYLPTLFENYSRRFYENRLVQLGSNDINLSKANKVALAISGTTVSSLEELGRIPSAAWMIGLHPSKDGAAHKHKMLLQSSERMRNRDRPRKDGMITTNNDSVYSEDKKNHKEEIWSNNLGVMVSNQPNYRDEASDVSMRNRTVDKFIMKGRGIDDPSYFVAYVASISGHTFLLAALLEDYIQLRKYDPSLEEDINNYIKACIIGNVQNGHHSIFEVLEIFEDENVKKIFTRNNINLDLSWHYDIVHQAMLDTQEYTKTLCLNRVIQGEIEELKKSESDQMALVRIADIHKHLKKQIDLIKKTLESKSDFSIFNEKSPDQQEITIKIITQLSALELESKDADIQKLKRISKDICYLIYDNSKKLSPSEKSVTNDDKFSTKLANLAKDLNKEYSLIEKIDDTILKPSQIKKSNYRK